MFQIGSSYTRDEIHAQLGGSKQAYIPTVSGNPVAICVRPDLNPRAPAEVLCGTGPAITRAGAALAAMRLPVPVFLKRSAGRWEYMGMYRVVESFTSGRRFDAMVRGTDRSASEVTLAVQLRRVEDSEGPVAELVNSLDITDLMSEAPAIVAWKQDLVSDIDSTAQFMWRGGPYPVMSAKRPDPVDPRPDKSYWLAVKQEMRLFLCTDDKKYKELWRRVKELDTKSTHAMVAMISAYLGSIIGVAGTAIAGFVALCLYGVVKIGKEAYCRHTSAA